MITVEDWALVTDSVDSSPHARTVFNLSNGFIGLRGALEEDTDIAGEALAGGFYETWPITYPEDAYGLARTGQTIQPVANPASFQLEVDTTQKGEGSALDPHTSRLTGYTRRLDLRTGELTRSFTWKTDDGTDVDVSSTRLVSLAQRGLCLMRYKVRVSTPCTVKLTNSLVLPLAATTAGEAAGPGAGHFDPRRSTNLDDCIEVVSTKVAPRLEATLTTKAARRTMTTVVDHREEYSGKHKAVSTAGPDRLSRVVTAHLKAGQDLTLTAVAAYDPDPRQARRLLDDLGNNPAQAIESAQAAYLDRWWAAADVEVGAQGDMQGRIRWNLFQAIQASAAADGLGIPAKGLSGSGYDGHTFWDSEAMMLPCLTYTAPGVARHALSYRYATLDTARERARELHLAGAAFAWRTIDGREASAFFEAGTAQFHINADIAYAINRYMHATDDLEWLGAEGIDVLVETARLWADLGFHSTRDGRFHIHGVTGPDEYSAMVDDNLYTNVMAAANLDAANHWLGVLKTRSKDWYEQAVTRLAVGDKEREAWRAASGAMAIPYDEELGLHGQDADFLTHEPWDFDSTPPNMYPLLLHYHPLTIYRHQVLKQADLVLALITRPDLFDMEQKRADFDYYDAITTGDSTLSASAQAIMAAETGQSALAESYFDKALNTDIDNTHGNTGDGVHVASATAVWSILVMGFAGWRDYGVPTLNPRLPATWKRLAFKLRWRQSSVRVEITHMSTRLELETTTRDQLDLTVNGTAVSLSRTSPIAYIRN